MEKWYDQLIEAVDKIVRLDPSTWLEKKAAFMEYAKGHASSSLAEFLDWFEYEDLDIL